MLGAFLDSDKGTVCDWHPTKPNLRSVTSARTNTVPAMTLPSVSPVSPGDVFLRPEQDDETFLSGRGLRSGVAGLILRPRQLLVAARDGEERRGRVARLKGLLSKPSTVWFMDPETACLVDPEIRNEPGARRMRESAIALSVHLPLQRDTLEENEIQQGLLEATWGVQAAAAALTAPYFRIARGDDVAVTLNLELLRRTALSDERPTVAVLEINIGAVTSGWSTGIARRLAKAGADIVLLRVVGCKEDAPQRHAAAYLRLACELGASKLQVICDQVGRLGPVLVAGAGAAFSTGSWHYRSVPRDLTPRSGGGGGSPAIPYELPGRWRSAGPSLARNLSSARCPVEGCRALKPNATPADQREHFLHTMVASAEEALSGGIDALVSSLTRSGDPVAAGWAHALREVQAESA